MPEHEEQEGPWTEAQWEAFMERQDIRSAKYGELFETFREHPDREDIIAREMGWLDDARARDDQEEEEEPEWRREMIAAMNQAAAEYDALSDEEKEQLRRADRDEIESIPAYSRGYKFGMQVHDALFPLIEGNDYEYDDDFIVALRDSMVIAAKIAGGHGMGYEDDALCGNIVNCKRSLAAAERCLAALQSLQETGRAPGDVVNPLAEEGVEVKRLIEEHIAELRSRVWWE